MAHHEVVSLAGWAVSGSGLLAGRYRVGPAIAEGGMGIVYAGEHVELKTRVAIKVLQPKLAEEPRARARFLREARLAASVTGDHATRIYDVGTDDDDRVFIVMEYLTGEGADARLERSGKLGVEDAATIVLQLLDALAEAHARGLVHRDVKPANLFLVDRPGEAIWVKVLDFGISKSVSTGEADALTTGNEKLTEPRTILGSPAYMSPEQLSDASVVDVRSDLWACGVVLYELLTGKMPFAGRTLPELYLAIMSAPPRSLAAAGVEGVPSAIAKAIERCLQKAPEDRPSSAYELAVMLAPHSSASAKALVPRIRAWCRSDDDVPAPPSRRVVLRGVALVSAAAVVAFVAASVRAPVTRASAPPREAELPGLDPPAPESPASSDVARPTPPPLPAPSAASSLAPRRETPTLRPAARGSKGELERIDLIP